MRTITIPYSGIKEIWPDFLRLAYEGILSNPPSNLRVFAARNGCTRRRAKQIMNAFFRAGLLARKNGHITRLNPPVTNIEVVLYG